MPDELVELFPELAGLFNNEATPPPSDSTPPPAEHGGVTDDDLNRFFAENPGIRSLPGLPPVVPGQAPAGPQFRSGVGAPPPVGGTEDGGTFTPSAPASAPAIPSTPPGQDAGIPQSFPQQGQTGQSQAPLPPPPVDPAVEQQQLAALGQLLRTDPELQAAFIAKLNGQPLPTQMQAPAPQIVAPPAPFQQQPRSEPILPLPQQQVSTPPVTGLPENLDLDDPNVKALYDMVVSTQSELAQQRQVLDQTRQASASAAEANVASLYRTASEGFAKRYDLEQTDVDHLSDVAARLGVLNTLSQGVDPLTGLPVHPDPIAAVDRALEIAYFTDPTYRQKEWERQAKVRREDQQRKQRLAAVQGNSGSAPRSQPVPQTQEGLRSGMVGEVRQMMSGEWSEPVAN